MVDTSKIKGKRFFYKVYTSAGDYITTWEADVVNTPSFTMSINAGSSDLKVILARPSIDFGETSDIIIGNEVKLFINDNTHGTRQIYHGIIRAYAPFGGDDRLEVTLMPYVVKLGDQVMKDGSGNTTKVFSSVDPSTMLTTIIGYLNAGFTTTNVDLTGTTISYTFKFVTYKECLDKIVELAPYLWYWHIDGEDNLYFKLTDVNTVDHTWIYGKHVKDIKAEVKADDLINCVYFLGGGDPNLYYKYEHADSITTYGRKDFKMKDSRVTNATTAQTMAYNKLDNYDAPHGEVTVTVVADSIDTARGYDLESVKIGDVVKVFHPIASAEETRWDEFVWDKDYWEYELSAIFWQATQVQEIKYDFDKITVKLQSSVKDISKRIEDLNRNQDRTDSDKIPTAPS